VAGLAETLTRLSQTRGLPPERTALAGDRLTDLDDFGSNPGQLRARIYVPDRLKPGSPLVVVLHGCTQTAAGYDLGSGWSRLADDQGFALLFPEQRRSNNPNLCFNWFVPHHVRRGSGEALSIRQMIDTVCARHAIDTGRVFVTGLSAGGAMASAMLATYPDVFAGGAIIAGLPYGMAASVPEAFQLMGGQGMADPVELMTRVRSASDHQGPWPRLSVWHGSADRTVDASNGRAVVDQWRLIHNVPAEPSRKDIVSGFPRRSWHAADGQVVIEEIVIPGMAHGTPLDVKSGAGKATAFMLDVGICSTLETARFWGLTSGEATGREAANGAPPVAFQPAGLALAARATPRVERLIRDEKPVPKTGPAGVGKIIEDALRAAGLMK